MKERTLGKNIAYLTNAGKNIGKEHRYCGSGKHLETQMTSDEFGLIATNRM